MNIAKQTEKLKKNIVGAINGSPLPITLKKYVMADIYRELEIEYMKQLSAKESEPENEQSVQ